MDAIKALSDNHLPDDRIAYEAPVRIEIGPEKRILTIRCLPMKPWERFQRLFGMFLLANYKRLNVAEWPEWGEKIEGVDRFRILCESLTQDRKMRKWTYALIRVALWNDPVNHMPWWRIIARSRARKHAKETGRQEPYYRQGMSWGYFLENATPEVLQKIFLLVYLYNIAAVKKNARFLAEQVLKMDLDRCLYSSYRSLAGLKGKFVRPRYPNSPYTNNDGLKPISPPTQAQPPPVAKEGADG